MKALLTTLVSLTTVITPIITTTNLSVTSELDNNINYHHKNLQIISKSLFRTTKESNIKLTLTLGATYGEINKDIYNTADVFKQHQLAAGYQVNYYKNDGDKDTINNDGQEPGDVYVIITADHHDPYWKGQTKYLRITIQKANLDKITNLTDLSNIKVDTTKKYQEIDSTVFNSAKQFANNKLAAGFTVNYFSDEEGKVAADNEEQVAGDIWVKITADVNDPYWTETTAILKITLTDKRSDLNTIKDLSGMDPIIVNPNLTYQQINKNVINTSNQLKSDPLTGNFTIQYFSDKFAKHVINNYYQQVGMVYVIITPDFHTGTKWKTNKIPIVFSIGSNDSF